MYFVKRNLKPKFYRLIAKYAYSKRVNEKVDIYNPGMVILEQIIKKNLHT